MKQFSIDATGIGTTDFTCIDRRGNAGDKFLLIVDMESGTGTVDVEMTPDDCIDGTPTIWIQHNILNNVTESCASTMNWPFQAIRLNVKKYNSGTITLRILQAGYHDY